MTVDKTINNVYIYQKYAFICTAFGIVKVNMERAEISETYILDQDISDVKVNNNNIYAKNKQGAVYTASLTDNLIDKSNWQSTSDYPDFTTDTSVWDEYINTVKTLNPGGPSNNCIGFMKFHNGKLYTCEGQDDGSEIGGCVQVLSDGEWTIYDNDIASKTGLKYPYTYCLDIDPNDDSHVFVGARNGLYEFINGRFINFYNSSNSPIEPFDGKNVDYELVSGVTFDKEGTLWLFNSEAPTQSLISLDRNGKFTSYNLPELMKLNGYGYTNRSYANLRDMRFDNNGNLWFVNDHWNIASFFRYTPSINRLLSFTSFTNQDGQQITNNYALSCTVNDENNVWIGLQQGLLLLEESQIEADNPVFTQVKVPRNDGTNLADYLLSGIHITAIAIDGGGRKWIGTNSDGVYLISKDNNTQIHHFTTSNSNLLSDKIKAIAINNSTGEVFFGTEEGLCSYMSDATEPSNEMTDDNVYAYPNPVEPGYTGLITVVGLSYDADVKILTSNGKLVSQGRSNGGTFTWDGCDLKGNHVAGGIYMVATATSSGDKGVVCKIAVIR